MTVNDLIYLLEAIEDKEQEIYVHDGYGFHSTDIELDYWNKGNSHYLYLDG